MEIKVSLEAFYKGEAIPVEISRQQLCKSCRGTGAKNPDSVRTCDTCRGKGVETIVQQLAPGFIQQMQTQCRKCGGKGKTFAETCSTCNGKRAFQGPTKLEVKVEPGMADGGHVKFDGMSDEHPDAESGDLYVVIRQEAHGTFKRNGADLYTEVTLTLAEALLGFDKQLAHLDGRKIKLTHPSPVTQPGQVQTIRGEGMPKQGYGSKGDLYVTYRVVFPTSFDKNQLSLLTKVFPVNLSKDEL